VKEASASLRHITGIDLIHQTADGTCGRGQDHRIPGHCARGVPG
jgi:hypothetical protein